MTDLQKQIVRSLAAIALPEFLAQQPPANRMAAAAEVQAILATLDHPEGIDDGPATT